MHLITREAGSEDHCALVMLLATQLSDDLISLLLRETAEERYSFN
jgi:hypothetical protein